ncbi:MAG: serpin family protein [Blastococcus sp.]|nr:serpin family protein [Blastococcus sp.]
MTVQGDLDDEAAPDAPLMSDRLWTAAGSQPEKGYLDDVATAFDAGVLSVDFAEDPAGARDRINQSVEEVTHGVIGELFEDDLDRDTHVVLTDATYWRRTGPTHSTAPGTRSSPRRSPAGGNRSLRCRHRRPWCPGWRGHRAGRRGGRGGSGGPVVDRCSMEDDGNGRRRERHPLARAEEPPRLGRRQATAPREKRRTRSSP